MHGGGDAAANVFLGVSTRELRSTDWEIPQCVRMMEKDPPTS